MPTNFTNAQSCSKSVRAPHVLGGQSLLRPVWVAITSLMLALQAIAATVAPNTDRPGGVPVYESKFDALDTDPGALASSGWSLVSLTGSTLLYEKPQASGNVTGRIACHVRFSGVTERVGDLFKPPDVVRTRCFAVGSALGVRLAPATDPQRQGGVVGLYKAKTPRYSKKGLTELLSAGWTVSSLSVGRGDWISGEFPGEAAVLLRRQVGASYALLCNLARRKFGSGEDWNSLCMELVDGSLGSGDITTAPNWSPADWFPVDLSLNGLLAQGMRIDDVSMDPPGLPGANPAQLSGRLALDHAGRNLRLFCDVQMRNGLAGTARCGGFVPSIGERAQSSASRTAREPRPFDAVSLHGGISGRIAEGFRPVRVRPSGAFHGGQWYVLEREDTGLIVGRWAMAFGAESALCVQGPEVLPLESGRVLYSVLEDKGSCIGIGSVERPTPRRLAVQTVGKASGSASTGFGPFVADRLPDAGDAFSSLVADGFVPMDIRLLGLGSIATVLLHTERSAALCSLTEGRSWCRKVEAACGATIPARQAALERSLNRMPRHDAGTGTFVSPTGMDPWSNQVNRARSTLGGLAARTTTIPQCDFEPWLIMFMQALAALPQQLSSSSVTALGLTFNIDAEALQLRAEIDSYFAVNWATTEVAKSGIDLVGEEIAGERQRDQFRLMLGLNKVLGQIKFVMTAKERYDLIQRARALNIPSADLEAFAAYDRVFANEFEVGRIGTQMLDVCNDQSRFKEPYTVLRCSVFYPALAERFARQLAQRIGARDALDPSHPLYFRKVLCRLEAQTLQGCSAAACQDDYRHVRGPAAAAMCIPE